MRKESIRTRKRRTKSLAPVVLGGNGGSGLMSAADSYGLNNSEYNRLLTESQLKHHGLDGPLGHDSNSSPLSLTRNTGVATNPLIYTPNHYSKGTANQSEPQFAHNNNSTTNSNNHSLSNNSNANHTNVNTNTNSNTSGGYYPFGGGGDFSRYHHVTHSGLSAPTALQVSPPSMGCKFMNFKNELGCFKIGSLSQPPPL
jgi:hypothetical protein